MTLPGAPSPAGAPEGPLDVAAVLLHEVLDRPFLGLPSRHLVFFVLAAIAVLIVARRPCAGTTIASRADSRPASSCSLSSSGTRSR